MTRTIALALALTGASPLLGAASAPVTELYQVSLSMQEGEHAPVRPSLVAASGEPATFVIANERYSLRVTATARDGRVAVASLISTWSPQGLRTDTPELDLAADGEPAALSFERIDPATRTTAQVRIEVSARPLAR